MSISEIVDYYGKRGFGAIAITDHLCEKQNIIGQFSHHMNLTLTPAVFGKYMEELQQENIRAKEMYGMTVVPGYEITKNSFSNHRSAHVLILGTTQYIDPELPVDEILRQAKNFGALTVAAHPFHTGAFEFQSFYLWSRRFELSKYIDAWEFNCRKAVSNDVLNSGLPLIANSDMHTLVHSHSWKTKIYGDNTQDALFSAIRSQNVDFFMDSP